MDKSQKILSDVVVFNKYSKFVPELQRRETWDEICDRNMAMHMQKYPSIKKDIKDVYKSSVVAKKVLPSMRSMQFAGAPIELSNSRIFNCAYAPMDHPFAFAELMFLLLGGTGVGYSVQKKHVNKLPIIVGPSNKTRRFLVGDSIEGWADAVKVLVKAYTTGKSNPVFDYRDIRPKGAKLVTSGGKAPGPDPLRICIEYLRSILNGAIGRKLSTLEVHDMCCHIADSVLAGGIRRAAMIVGFDIDDMDMLFCKSGSWWELNPQRGRANNSVILKRGEVTEDQFKHIWDIVERSGAGEPGFFWTNDEDVFTNPCCFTGDTVVATADGRNGVTIKQLADESCGAVKFPVYSARKRLSPKENHHWVTEIKNAVAFKTGTKEVIDIILSNGTSFRCTPDHRIATKDGRWIPAEFSEGEHLQNFYSFSNKNTKKSYRHINSLTNGFARQYRMIWEFNNGDYDSTKENIDHCNDDSTDDSLENLKLLGIEDHKKKTKRFGLDNPIHKCDKEHLKSYTRRSSILSNGLQHGWSDERISAALMEFDDINGIISRGDNNVYMNDQVHVVGIIWTGEHEDVYDLTVEDNHNFYIITDTDDDRFLNSSGVLVHNCEISLRPNQFCNLSEVNVSDVESQADLNSRVRDAAIIGTLQAGYTDFHYLRPIWKETTEEEALIGVGMTGIGSGAVLKYDLEEAAQVVLRTNEEYATKIGINIAARTTTIKPSGTASCVVGSASGIHAWHNDYYIRRMRVGKNEALYHYIKKTIPALVEDCVFKPHLEAVLSIPQKAPEGAILRTESALQLLERVKKFNLEWVRPGYRSGKNHHNVSCTISLKDNDWIDVGNWMWDNREHYTGISVLPFNGGTYQQAPFEDCTKEVYEDMMKHCKNIDLTKIVEMEDVTSLMAEAACAGGACEVTTL
jgi:hypothetical protein